MASFDLRKYITNLPNQQNIGCCTATASLLAVEIMSSISGKPIKLSRLYTYYYTRKLQNRVGQNGAELLSTMNSMVTDGMASDMYWPFHFNRVNVQPSVAAINDAQKYKVRSFESANPDSFKNHLHNNTPIIIGLHTGKMFWRQKGPLSKLMYKIINTTDNRNFRGHAVTIVGYDDSILDGSWIVANSTGLIWGDHGFGILPYECRVDIGESYVITEMTHDKNF